MELDHHHAEQQGELFLLDSPVSPARRGLTEEGKRGAALREPWRVRVMVIVVGLSLLSLVVPCTVTGVVIAAIDSVLLDDHIPKTAMSHADAVADVVTSALIASASAEAAQLVASLDLGSRLKAWAAADPAAVSEAVDDSEDIYQLIQAWNRSSPDGCGGASYAICGTRLAAALNEEDSSAGVPSHIAYPGAWWDLIFRYGNATAMAAVVRLSIWQRVSNATVRVQPLVTADASLILNVSDNITRRGVNLHWRNMSSHAALVEAGWNSSTTVWCNASDPTDRSMDLHVDSSSVASGWVLLLDPCRNGTTRNFFPVSKATLAGSYLRLQDGLYLDVITNRGSSQAQQAWWNSVLHAGGVESVITKQASSSSGISTISSTVSVVVEAAALYHAPSRTMMSCGSTVGAVAATAAPYATYLPPSMTVASALNLFPSADLDGAAGLGGNLDGCRWIAAFLVGGGWDGGVGVRGALSTPAAASNYYFDVASLHGSALRRAAPIFAGMTAKGGESTEYMVVMVVPQSATETAVVRTRGQIAVVAFVVAVVTVFLLVLTIRLMVRPLATITRAILACVALQLHRMEMMESSIIAEVADIQQSLSYLAVRVHQYLKFFPDQKILERIADDEDNDEDDSDNSNHTSGGDDGDLFVSDEDGGGAGHRRVGGGFPSSGTRGSSESDEDASSLVVSSEGGASVLPPAAAVARAAPTRNEGGTRDLAASSHQMMVFDSEWGVDEKLHEQRRKKLKGAPIKTPSHSIRVHVQYESRHLNRNTFDRSKLANKQATFVFKHRITDPVLSMLTRQCRAQLREHPGEVLLLFTSEGLGGLTESGSSSSSTGGGGHWRRLEGMRQLSSDEDVLFAIERCRTNQQQHYTQGSVEQRPETTLVLHARKGSSREVLPLLIALSTLLSVASRLVLSIQRLSSSNNDTQVLGLLLLGCLAVQVAQNALISLYLVRRFSLLDHGFREWAVVSRADIVVAVLFGSLNVTNLEIMSCHVRIGTLRLSAPISPWLRVKISKYSFVGFIVGDLLPFVFILINIILNELYQDVLTLLSVAFSILSVTSILVTHGLLRFVVSESIHPRGSSPPGTSAGRVGEAMGYEHGGNGLQGSTASSIQRFGNGSRSLMLSKRDITLLRIGITEESTLIDVCSVSLIDSLITRLYECVQHAAMQAGGLLLEAHGLTATILFNAHAVVPDHARVTLQCFLRLRAEIERDVLATFFTGEKFRSHILNALPSSARRDAAVVSSVVYKIHAKHRIVGSMVSDSMAAGYVGTLTAQTFQLVGVQSHIADALLSMNEFYGSTLLTTDTTKLLLDNSLTARRSHVTKSDDEGGHRGWMRDRRALMRRLDDLVLSDELVMEAGTRGQHGAGRAAMRDLLQPYSRLASGGRTIAASASVALAPTAPLILSRGEGPSQATIVTVFEVIVHAFLPSSTVSITGWGEETSAQTAASPMPHAQLRRRQKSVKTYEAVRQFEDAVDVWRSLRNDAPMKQYLADVPDDHVARRIFHWLRFVGTPGASLGLVRCQQHHSNRAFVGSPSFVPSGGLGCRVLSSVGIVRHPCETYAGSQLEPNGGALGDDIVSSLQDSAALVKEKLKKFRPPRSERRAAVGVVGSDDRLHVVGSGSAVIDQILRVKDSGYDITFHNPL